MKINGLLKEIDSLEKSEREFLKANGFDSSNDFIHLSKVQQKSQIIWKNLK